MSTIDVGMRLGDAIDPFHLANGFEAVIGNECVESFNKNMKALGVLESKWNPIRQKLVRRLMEEQDKVLRSYFAQKGGTRGQRRGGAYDQGREHVKWDMYV